MNQEENCEFSRRLKEILQTDADEKKSIDTYADELKRGFSETPNVVYECHNEFEKITGLSGEDVVFCIFAATLQIVRQYLATYFKDRLTDKEAAQKTPFHSEEHSQRKTKRYYATKEEIVSNPVPFDVVQKEDKIKVSKYNPLLNGANHRYKALGHDPILGLIIGTANIMTKTITVSEGMSINSYHVHSATGVINRNGVESIYSIDKINAHASTPLIFEHIFKRISEEGSQAWEALGYALVKEVVHLCTDLPTKQSLPIPIISVFSPTLAKALGKIGLDMFNVLQVGFQYTLSTFINWLIAALHRLSYNEDNDVSEELFKVKTQKIIQYSNEIATVSNSLITAVNTYFNPQNACKYFDIGGALVTLNKSWNTPIEIAKIKNIKLNSAEYSTR